MQAYELHTNPQKLFLIVKIVLFFAFRSRFFEPIRIGKSPIFPTNP
mgnify:CR=1 FL=1|jgi:hypothetical protein